uniref:cDNA FLJ44054 fis, clone TESTI4034212 n=1 Tax=Homo sapiens TaxID=9606 RepID=Q6ZU18_HUMAN|nr:unnamed protein product [Homo sapiens]
MRDLGENTASRRNAPAHPSRNPHHLPPTPDQSSRRPGVSHQRAERAFELLLHHDQDALGHLVHVCVHQSCSESPQGLFHDAHPGVTLTLGQEEKACPEDSASSSSSLPAPSVLGAHTGVGPQAGGHVPGWQDLSTVKLDAPAGPVLPARIPLPQDALHTLRIPSRCSGACTEGLGPAPGNSKEANGFMSRFCQIASEAALFAVAAECRAGHLSGQSGALLPCISWAMRGDLCPLHRSCVPCACDRVFPVYSMLLHVFQFRFVVCE